MPKGKVTVPSTLSGHAGEIYSSAFTVAYEGTCKDREDRDACAAKIAWSAVKKKYKKDGDKWVSRAGDPVVGPISSVPNAGVTEAPTTSGEYSYDSPKGLKGTKAQRWKLVFARALAEECRNSDNPVECARAVANAKVGYTETDVEPIEKTIGRVKGDKYPLLRLRGGPGSGHHGHRGRPGEVGGSLPAGGTSIREPGGMGNLPKGSEPHFVPGGRGVISPNRARQLLETYDSIKQAKMVLDNMKRNPDLALNARELEQAIKLYDFYNDTDDRDRGMDTAEQEYGAGFGQGDYISEQGGKYEPSGLEKKLDGMRRHKFLTKEIENKLPPLYSTENDPDPMVYAKWFHPYATQEWYATEYDPKQGLFFGWVNSGTPELGYFSRQELAEVNPRGIPVERDKYFKPKPLSEVKQEAMRQIPPEEYNFRLGSVLRGEADMDEHPLKDKLDGYKERADERKRLNAVDYELIRVMGDQPIVRPERIPSTVWRDFPPRFKTVRSEATRRIIERNYAQAVEDAQFAGWKAKINHYQPEEYYFIKAYPVEGHEVIIRAVLVRDEDSVDWRLHHLGAFASGTDAVQLPYKVLRHHHKNRLKIPHIERGGPGSGHHGHKGRPGEVGGSLPSGATSIREPGGESGRTIGKPQTVDGQTSKGTRGLTAMIFHDPERTDFAGMGLLDEFKGTTENGLEEWTYWLGTKGPFTGYYSPKGLKEPGGDYGDLGSKSLSEIASIIRQDWGSKVNFAAKPYLEALGALESIDDNYWNDPGKSIVAYFLSNAGQWRGDTAREVKKELNRRLKGS